MKPWKAVVTAQLSRGPFAVQYVRPPRVQAQAQAQLQGMRLAYSVLAVVAERKWWQSADEHSAEKEIVSAEREIVERWRNWQLQPQPLRAVSPVKQPEQPQPPRLPCASGPPRAPAVCRKEAGRQH